MLKFEFKPTSSPSENKARQASSLRIIHCEPEILARPFEPEPRLVPPLQGRPWMGSEYLGLGAFVVSAILQGIWKSWLKIHPSEHQLKLFDILIVSKISHAVEIFLEKDFKEDTSVWFRNDSNWDEWTEIKTDLNFFGLWDKSINWTETQNGLA